MIDAGDVTLSKRSARNRRGWSPFDRGSPGRRAAGRHVAITPASFLYGYGTTICRPMATNGLPAGTHGRCDTDQWRPDLRLRRRSAPLVSIPRCGRHGASTMFDRLSHQDRAAGPDRGRRRGWDRSRYVRGLPPGYLRRAYGPGWALVGDAGHWMDPMSTHGMTSALRDATLLARAILASSARARERERALAGLPGRPRSAVPADDGGHRGDRLLYLGSAPYPRSVAELSSAMTDEVEALASHRTGPMNADAERDANSRDRADRLASWPGGARGDGRRRRRAGRVLGHGARHG